MLRVVLATCLLAGPALAQSTVPVQDAPFKQAGDLAARLDPMAIVDSDIYEIVPAEELTGELLSASRVVDYNGNRIGAVSGVIEEAGEVSGIVLTVGGAFGVLDHPVAVPLGALIVGRSDERGDSRIVVGMTQKELESLPPYDG